MKANPQLSQSTIFRIWRFRRILAIPVSLLALFVGMTVLLPSDTAIYAQQNGVGQTGQSGKQQIPVSRGNASQRGLINFTDLANKERLNPPPPKRLTIHQPLEEDEATENKSIPPGAYTPSDTGRLASPGIALPSPSLAAGFSALDDDNTRIPADTHGAVGPNHLLVALNSQVRIQTKTGSALATVSLNGFWATFGHTNVFDPRVYYEPFSSRWIFVALTDFRTASSSMLIGVTQTNDPMGNWNLYDIDFDSSNTVFADYPNVGFNKNWIVVTANSYRNSDKGFVDSHIYTFDKSSLYAGTGSPFRLFQDPSGNSQVPAVTYDNNLSTMYLIENWNGNSGGNGYLRLSTISGAVGSEVLTSGIAYPSTPNPWDGAPPGGAEFAPQLGSAHKISTGDAVVQNLVYRNGSLWCAQTVFLPAGGAPTRSSIQWWQLAADGALEQRGRIDDTTGNVFYAFPSIAVNQNNDVLIGYSQFSTTQYAGAGYSFRASSDPLNTLRDSATLKNGQAPYYKINSGTRNKWGDYSNTLIDSLNSTAFWTIQTYAATPSAGVDRWGTWWGRIDPSSPPPAASDVVLYATDATLRAGNWQIVSDTSAAGGARLFNPDAGAAKITAASANPGNYFEITFPAQASTPYHLWMRGKALNDYWGNDSVFVQFSDSVDSTGAAIYRIGTTSATEYNLEDCSGCALQGWGWQDNGWGVGVMGPPVYFQTTGTHTIRIQVREDGLSLDQIVLSPSTYFNVSPGALKNDTTILTRSGNPPPAQAPSIQSITPDSGTITGATSVTINGSNFVSGASVSFGGAVAGNVNVVNSNTITAATPSHTAGTVDVVVTNSTGQSGTLTGGYTYVTTPVETILLSDNFNDNSLDTTKWIANNLFSGFTDANVAATEINQRFEIGPMPVGVSGSHYNGIRSTGAFNFSGAYCYMELVQAAAANTTADVMLTIGQDVNNYYRIYVEAGVLYLQKRIQGTKTALHSRPYDAVNHRYLQIRHNSQSGAVIFEVAADQAGVPGNWTLLYSEPWNAASIPLTAVVFEVKAGTWQSEVNSGGKVIIDNFKVARP